MMNDSEDELIGRLKLVTHGDLRKDQQAKPPVSLADLTDAETIIGFPLPTLLRRIYLEVGNGGFGPGYGLFPLLQKVSKLPCDGCFKYIHIEMIEYRLLYVKEREDICKSAR